MPEANRPLMVCSGTSSDWRADVQESVGIEPCGEHKMIRASGDDNRNRYHERAVRFLHDGRFRDAYYAVLWLVCHGQAQTDSDVEPEQLAREIKDVADDVYLTARAAQALQERDYRQALVYLLTLCFTHRQILDRTVPLG